LGGLGNIDSNFVDRRVTNQNIFNVRFAASGGANGNKGYYSQEPASFHPSSSGLLQFPGRKLFRTSPGHPLYHHSAAHSMLSSPGATG
jgi:hypothetical protein